MLQSSPKRKFSPPTHFKIDENVPVGVLRILQVRGVDASTAPAQGLRGARDKQILLHCRKHKMILLTLDKDFARPGMYASGGHCGIVVLRPRSAGQVAVLDLLGRSIRKLDFGKMRDKIVVIEENHIRVR